MSLEIEAKVRVDSHEPIRSRLIELGADRVGVVLETNHIFDDADRSLSGGDCALRIRECKADDGDAPVPTLTYKGRRLPGELKQREEIQVCLDDGGAGRRILERLGFVETVCFEKRRESWRWGECQIELDEVPYLGRFVEIEGPDGPSIARVRESLGLAETDLVRENYIEMLVDYCQANGLPTEDITFDRSEL